MRNSNEEFNNLKILYFALLRGIELEQLHRGQKASLIHLVTLKTF